MAVDIAPDFIEAHYQLGKLLSGGRRINDEGTLVVEPENELAGEHFAIVIALDKTHHKAHFNLGKVQAALGDRDGALGEFQAALAIAPDHAKAHFHLALLLLDEAEGKEAGAEVAVAGETGK